MSTLKIAGIGVGVIALGIGISLATGAYRYVTAPFYGAVDAEVQIESAPSRIQRYQEFFNLCQGIQAKEDAIDALLANTTMDPNRRDTAITANQAARSSLIAEYNSLSAQSYTAARFKASNLPYQIGRGLYIETNRTNCVTGG